MTEAVKVGRLEDWAPGSVKQVVVGEHRLAVVRIDDDVYVIGDRCSHENVSLSEGEVLCEDRELECWKHGSTFSLVDGNPQSLPATKAVPVYEARVVDGEIEVVLGG
ncbi:MAG TPA: non-heme iron oxygenase ferredoxin subunit [Acidimicrobiales bacterium]|nr:non-heme iron oxygenase ferredoxin subunit [Acidimicrobiales bacterium]